MNKHQYKQYLLSDHWIRVKDQYSRTYKHICYLCLSPKFLDLHHVTYERLGAELMTDLVYLCRDCHGMIHKDGSDFDDIRKWVDPVARPADKINEKAWAPKSCDTVATPKAQKQYAYSSKEEKARRRKKRKLERKAWREAYDSTAHSTR